MMLSPRESLYIRGIVISANEKDVLGEALSPAQIKTLITRLDEFQADENHSTYNEPGMKIIESYAAPTAGHIAGKFYERGSWLATTRISDPEIVEKVKNGKLNGYSLGSKGKLLANVNKGGSTTLYSDMDWETVRPEFISVVGLPTNLAPIEVFDYESYLAKGFSCASGECSLQTLSRIIDDEQSEKALEIDIKPILNEDSSQVYTDVNQKIIVKRKKPKFNINYK